ncbi:MAG: sugar transferase [candidate division WOR-3 bacterium]
MSFTTSRSEESVILIEVLLLLLGIALLRLLLDPVSRSLTTVVMLWIFLLTTSYIVGEFETAVRANFGFSLKTQAAFALSYVAYSGVHIIWPWCEGLTVKFWLGLWLYLNILAPLLGLVVRRLIRQRAVLVTDPPDVPRVEFRTMPEASVNSHCPDTALPADRQSAASQLKDRVQLLRWWGFECVETVSIGELADWLRKNADQYGRVKNCEVVVVDIADYRTEYAVSAVAGDYFADFVGIPSFSFTGYLVGPHPRHIGPYAPNVVARRVKRVIDLVVSGLVIILSSPFMLAVAVLIKLDSPGPVLYKHRRLGRNMRPFWLLKFRTMYRDADERLHRILESDPKLAEEFKATFKLKNDPRVTRIGRFLRRFSIDEAPQLFNIIANQMSWVGPRPIVEKEVEYYRDYSLLLFRVLPGATGLWQISGRSETSYQERVELDTRYVQEWSLWRDLAILFKTVPAVLQRRGAY